MEPSRMLDTVTLSYILKIKIVTSHRAVAADLPPLSRMNENDFDDNC